MRHKKETCYLLSLFARNLVMVVSWWRICLQCRRPHFDSWVRNIPWRRDRLPTPVFLGFPCGSAGKESTCYVGDLGQIPGLGRCPGERKGYPFQYFGLENSMDCIQSMGSQRVGHDWVTCTFRRSLHFVLLFQNLWFRSVVQLFATQWTATKQTSLSFTVS